MFIPTHPNKQQHKTTTATMHILLMLLLAATLPLLTLAYPYETILTQGATLEAGKSIVTSNGACRLSLQHDGNLVARRRGPFWPKPGMSSDPIPQSISWTSGSHGIGDYYATVTSEGNLQVISRGNNQVKYSTHVCASSNDASATHELVFTEKCALRVMRTEGNESPQRVWTNIHEWLDNFSADEYNGLDNVLGKGEYFTYPGQNYGVVCGGTTSSYCFNVPISLRLQHDCNLVAFVGHDQGDKSAVVWSAGRVRSNASDCFMLVDSHDVALYEGPFDPTAPVDFTPPNKYWSVPSSFFDVDEYNPQGRNWYQILLNVDGEMYLDYD
jgi:hypothetical protein